MKIKNTLILFLSIFVCTSLHAAFVVHGSECHDTENPDENCEQCNPADTMPTVLLD